MNDYSTLTALFTLFVGFLGGWFASKIYYEKKAKKAGLL